MADKRPRKIAEKKKARIITYERFECKLDHVYLYYILVYSQVWLRISYIVDERGSKTLLMGLCQTSASWAQKIID
jgi:hypothetical protein